MSRTLYSLNLRTLKPYTTFGAQPTPQEYHAIPDNRGGGGAHRKARILLGYAQGIRLFPAGNGTKSTPKHTVRACMYRGKRLWKEFILSLFDRPFTVLVTP